MSAIVVVDLSDVLAVAADSSAIRLRVAVLEMPILRIDARREDRGAAAYLELKLLRELLGIRGRA